MCLINACGKESVVRRIGTLNCGHAAFPIILGVNEPQYTPEELEKFREDNAKGITYEGKNYTGYEATQMQRKLETAMRRQKRRILVDEATGDKDKLLTDQIKLQRLRQEYSRFSEAAGLRTENERAQVAGFGKGQAARASAAAKQSAGQSVGQERLAKLRATRLERLKQKPELALPNASEAVIEEGKFTKYLFSPENKRGYAKGVAFTSRLGYDINNWKELQKELLASAKIFPARKTGDRGHGMTYEQKVVLRGKNGNLANAIVAWIEERGRPRMVTVYIKEVKEHDD